MTPALQALVRSIEVAGELAPELVAAELRPLVVSLLDRTRTCSVCGTGYLQKRAHHRRRTYCDTCRNGGTRRKQLDATADHAVAS